MSNANKIAFLLGSGISIHAGMPTTSNITARILSGEAVTYHSDGTYYLDDLSIDLASNDNVWRIVLLLKRIQIEIDSYYWYDHHHTTNYEEIYYVCSQIHDSIFGEYDNPIVESFIDKLTPYANQLTKPRPNSIVEWNFERLISEALNYIRDVVWRLLLKEPGNLGYLNCITDACLDPQIQKVDLYTLNHDTILESALFQRRIDSNIGFGNFVNDVRYWDSLLHEKDESKVCLLKLHGSINWFRFQPNQFTHAPIATGIPKSWDIWDTYNPTGERQYPEGGRPEFLAGTFNKMLSYTNGIYADLFCLFRRNLRNIDTLIVCGYSFGDKGINSQVVDWMYLSEKKQMIIVHKEPDRLLEQSRGVIRNNWEEWSRQNRVPIVRKWVEDCTWNEIKANITFIQND